MFDLPLFAQVFAVLLFLFFLPFMAILMWYMCELWLDMWKRLFEEIRRSLRQHD